MKQRMLPAGLLLAALSLDGLATWTLLASPWPARLGALLWALASLALLGATVQLALSLPRGRRALGAVAALLLCASVLSTGWRHAPDAWALIAHTRAGLQVEVLEGGRVLRLSGPLGAGDASRLIPQLGPVQRVEISSSGGSPGDALALADALRERPRTVLLRGPCARDCALLFLASAQRLALPDAYLGLQHLRSPSWNPLWQRWLDGRLAPAYAPLSPLQQQRLRLTPAPSLSLLQGADLESVLTRPDNPLALVLPPQPAAPGDYLLALQTHAVWPSLEARFPGSLETLGAELAAQPDDAARQQLAWMALRGRAVQLAAEAVASLRLQALELLAEQMKALGDDDAACRALGRNDAVSRERLPRALQLREAEWFRDTARDVQRDVPQLKSVELEMLSIVIGRSRLQGIDALRSGELGCAASRSLLDTLLALPPAQRRLAAKRWALSAAAS